MVAIPEDLQVDPRYSNGASLQLVPVAATTVAVQGDTSAWNAFFALRGILAHSDYDPNAELEAEKQRELAEERY